MTKFFILTIIICILFLIILGVFYFFKINVNQNQIQEINLEQYSLNPGLNIITISEDQGIIFGGYKDNNISIFFFAQRLELNPLYQRIFFDAPKFNIIACYTSETGDPFNVQEQCSIIDKTTKEIDIDQRTKEFELSFKVANELKNKTFPKELEETKQALINSALSITKNDLYPVTN